MVDLTPNMLVFSLLVNGLNTAMNSKHCQTRQKRGKTKTTILFTRDRYLI